MGASKWGGASSLLSPLEEGVCVYVRECACVSIYFFYIVSDSGGSCFSP